MNSTRGFVHELRHTSTTARDPRFNSADHKSTQYVMAGNQIHFSAFAGSLAGFSPTAHSCTTQPARRREIRNELLEYID